jgi:hypothetical protein
MAIGVGIAAFYSIEAIRYCVSLLRWLPRHERWTRTTGGLCPICAYDLTGNVSGTCPECGTTIGPGLAESNGSIAPSLLTERQPPWVWPVVVAMMTLAVVLKRLL